MKTIYNLFLIVFILGSIHSLKAQVDLEYWDNAGNINIYGGISYPNSEFSSKTSNGLFAGNAFQFGFEGHYIIKYGLGLGLDLGGEWYKFDKEAFSSYANPESIVVKGGYSSSYFGLNFVANLPIVIDDDHFTINLFAVGTAGLRGIRIPSIDLTYDEILNRYVEVTYRSRANTTGYLAYRGGIQFLFNNKFGLSLSYKGLKRDKVRMNYSVRMFDAEGELYEEENYLNSYFNAESYQIGFMFLLGVD